MKIVILRLKLMRKIVEMNEIVKNSSKQVILVKKSTINAISKQWLEPLGSAQYFDEPFNSRVFGLGRFIKRFGLIWVWFIGLHACPSFWVNIELQSLHIFNVVQYYIDNIQLFFTFEIHPSFYLGVFSEKSEMNSLVLRSGAKMPSIGFGTFVGGKNSADAYKGIWIWIKPWPRM